MNVFRIATSQAIREIVEENAVQGRFGLILTEENVDQIAQRVVDLFEITLELRAKVQGFFGQTADSQTAQTSTNKATPKKQPLAFHEGPFPKTKNASEIYHYEKKMGSVSSLLDSPALAPGVDLKLPRKRFELSADEKEKLNHRTC